MLKRLFRHMTTLPLHARKHFPPATLDAIAAAISTSEHRHRGEIRVVIEHGLDWLEVWRGTTARQQAEALFGELRIWDTEDNSGILFYLLLADHAIEIVVDRGIRARVPENTFATICSQMQAAFTQGQFETGLLQGIAACTDLLQQHFPAQSANPNELPDQPLLR